MTPDAKRLVDELQAEREPVSTRVLAALRRKPVTLADLARICGCTQAQARAGIKALVSTAYTIHQTGQTWTLEEAPPRGGVRVQPYLSDKRGRYRFGFISDTHLCNQHARLDVARELYRWFEREGAERVFHGGNWIDGEFRHNKYELLAHGMERQIDYFVQEYPVSTLTTHAVAGDDHEGWYQQREGINIGRLLESRMRDAGRDNWVHLGYMEAMIPLRHAVTGATERLLLSHPGGGSAYAHSYSPQKYVESLEGGEKPAVLLLGHWHKMSQDDIRNVWTIQIGCTEDQTPFARKKRLDFHIGGGICDLEQDPHTGAIVGCRVEFKRFYNRSYYTNNRWSHGTPIAQPVRSPRR